MKRPALIAAAGFICGCLLAAWQVFIGFILGILTVIVCLAFKVLGKKGLPLILYVIFLFAGYVIMKNSMNVRKEMEAIDEDTVITVMGEADDIEEGEYGLRLILKIKGGYCMANLYDESLKALSKDTLVKMLGNKIGVTGRKKDFMEAANPGNFSEKSFSYSKGIILKLNAEKIEITDDVVNEFKLMAYKLREHFNSTMHSICTDDRLAGVFMAIIYGDKGQLHEEIKSTFSDGGISHVLVISGLHISIAGMGIFYLLRRLMEGKYAAVISSLIMIMYVIVAGAGVSAVRAVIMFLTAIVGKLTGRIYDMKNAIAVAVIILLAGNPYYLFNTSFLLSFSSVAGIAFILPCVIRFINTRNTVIKSFVTSMTVNIVNGPIIADTYFEVPLYSVALNIIVVPLMSVLVICGLLGLMAGQLWVEAGAVIIYPAVWVINFYELLCKLAMKLPLASIVTGHFDIWQLLLYYGTIILVTYVMYKITETDKNVQLKPFMRTAVAGFSGVVLSLALYIAVPKRNTITFLDVGQGDSSVFVSGSGMVCIFDAGSTSRDRCGSYNILPYLKYSGISHIDYIILSHSDADHINGVEEILDDNAISVDNVIVASQDEGFNGLIQKISENTNINIINGFEGTFIEEETTRISLLNPGTASMDKNGELTDDINDRSIVAVIETSGRKIVMTGDIGEETENLLAVKYGDNYKELYGGLSNADILKVAHHGSKYSSSDYFLSLVSPELAVISCGENNIYGHPHEEALKRLDLYAENVEVTYKTGAVTVYLDNSDTLTYDILKKN